MGEARASRSSAAAEANARSVRPRGIGVDGVSLQADASALDRLIHERVRLGIVSALAVNQTLSFNDLKGLLGVTDGNLSAHARKLEDSGYIRCLKDYDGRVPRTRYRLTAAGRAALEAYLEHMEALIRAVRD